MAPLCDGFYLIFSGYHMIDNIRIVPCSSLKVKELGISILSDHLNPTTCLRLSSGGYILLTVPPLYRKYRPSRYRLLQNWIPLMDYTETSYHVHINFFSIHANFFIFSVAEIVSNSLLETYLNSTLQTILCSSFLFDIDYYYGRSF